MVLISGFVFLLTLEAARASCSFPSDLVGTWRSTRWDDLVFTSTEVTVPDMDDIGTFMTFACDANDGSYYLLRSTTTVVILGNNVEVVACLDLNQDISGVKYIYYHATNELDLPSQATQPVRLLTPGTAITTADTCVINSPSTGTNDVLIKTDQIANAVITCPDTLLANFDNYTVTLSTGVTACDGTGYIHICDDSETVLVEYSLCSEVIFYSAGGSLSCVHYSSSGDTYYVNLLNNDNTVDNSNYYFYTCLVIDYTASPVYASQWPRKCSSSQTATSVPSTLGYTFEMYTNLTCVPTEETDSSSSGTSILPLIIAAVVGGLFLFAFIILLVLKGKKLRKMLCKKKKKKRGKKGQVDPMSETSTNSHAPMDGQRTGLQATALVSTDRSLSVNTTESTRRNLETSQSTRSAITVNHMQMDLVEDPNPRRLPPLEPIIPDQPHRVSDTSDTPSLTVNNLPPINEQAWAGGQSAQK